MKRERMSGKGSPSDGSASKGSSYLLANLLWYAFLVLVAIATFLTTGRVFDDVFVDVLKFLFILMGGGFTLATFLDIFYERVYVSKDAGERP